MEFVKWLEEKRQGLSEKAQQQRGLIPSDEIKCPMSYKMFGVSSIHGHAADKKSRIIPRHILLAVANDEE